MQLWRDPRRAQHAPKNQSVTRQHAGLWQLLPFVLVLCMGCALEAPSTPEPELAEPELHEQASTVTSEPAACCGVRSTLVEGIKAAENLLISSDERLFVTGDEGIYELVRNADGTTAAHVLEPASGCQFGGMAETKGVLYANCYNFTDSFLYAAKLTEVPRFRRIASLPGILLANGLTADDAGNLYVATTIQDQILRLRFAAKDRFTVIENRVWLAGSGLFTNGLKHFASSLYWSDSLAIKQAAILADGRPGPVRTLATRLTFFDDLYVDEQGILVADYLGNGLRAYDLRGNLLNQTSVALTSPSSVLRAKGRAGFSRAALIVTEKDANRVAVIEPR